MNRKELDNLLYEALETELAGIKVYETAVRAAANEDLLEDWQEYLEQTRHHVQILRDVLEANGLDQDAHTTGRGVVRTLGQALVKAMELARATGPADAAQLVSAECVCLVEAKHCQNWELIGTAAGTASGPAAKAIRAAHREVRGEHRRLTDVTRWARWLRIEQLGLLDVPEEEERAPRKAIPLPRERQQRAPTL